MKQFIILFALGFLFSMNAQAQCTHAQKSSKAKTCAKAKKCSKTKVSQAAIDAAEADPSISKKVCEKSGNICFYKTSKAENGEPVMSPVVFDDKQNAFVAVTDEIVGAGAVAKDGKKACAKSGKKCCKKGEKACAKSGKKCCKKGKKSCSKKSEGSSDLTPAPCECCSSNGCREKGIRNYNISFKGRFDETTFFFACIFTHITIAWTKQLFKGISPKVCQPKSLLTRCSSQ